MCGLSTMGGVVIVIVRPSRIPTRRSCTCLCMPLQIVVAMILYATGPGARRSRRNLKWRGRRHDFRGGPGAEVGTGSRPAHLLFLAGTDCVCLCGAGPFLGLLQGIGAMASFRAFACCPTMSRPSAAGA